MLTLNQGNINMINTGLPLSKGRKKNVKNLALGKASIKPLYTDYEPLKTSTLSTNNWMKPQGNCYSQGPIQMLPGLYLGDENNASNSETLKRLNIGFVLNVAKEVENPLLQSKNDKRWELMFNNNLSLFLEKYTLNSSSGKHDVYAKKFYWDHNQPDLKEFFKSAFNFIDLALSSNKGILIHCQCGVSRSASLMMAYVMNQLKLDFDATYQYVKNRSNVVSPNLSLITQLIEFEKELVLNNQITPSMLIPTLLSPTKV